MAKIIVLTRKKHFTIQILTRAWGPPANCQTANKGPFMSQSPTKAAALAALTAAAFAAGSTAQEEGGGFEIPYGNLGLNYASAKIAEGQNYLSNDYGISPFFSYYGVIATNPHGGAHQGTNYTQEIIYGINADLEKILGWKNTTLTVSGAYDSGTDLSNKIGNLFTIADSSVPSGAFFYEMYIAKTFEIYDGTLQITLGRSGMADIFNTLPVFGNLVSGGLDNSAEAVFLNSPFTSSPTATWAATAQYTFAGDEFSLAGGIYQIPRNVNSQNYHGIDWRINSSNGYMMLGQFQWTPEFSPQTKDGKKVAGTGLQGVYQVGAYCFGGYDMPKLDGSGTRGNAYGFYAQAQQMLWRDQNMLNRYVLGWVGVQYSPVKSISTMPIMGYAGFQLSGFVPGRADDSFLCSWLIGSVNSDYSTQYKASYETAIEVSYIFQLNQNISIQPDIQYIMRPAGNSYIPDALVLAGQIAVSF